MKYKFTAKGATKKVEEKIFVPKRQIEKGIILK